MSIPDAPTLLYPRGGETILTPEVTVRWELPSSSDPTWTEVFYAEYFDTRKEPDWKRIAVLPSPLSEFVWRPRGVRSESVRFAVRTTNGSGEKSVYSVSGSNVSIQRRRLATPDVVSPRPGHRYDKYISIQTEDSAILNTISQRTCYHFYYSSQEANIPPTLIAELPVGSDPFVWNTVGLPPAKDYLFEVLLADDDGNASTRLFIPIEIAHEGYFVVDTQPPESAIVVNSNATFTNSKNVSVQIVSYDETTAVHSMRLFEGNTASPPDSISNTRSFQLSDGDGVKSVELLLQDFGGNRNDQVVQRLFQVLVELDNTIIADIALDGVSGALWAVTSGSGKYLYQIVEFPSRKTTFTDDPTAVAVYQQQPYVATAAANRGTLVKYTDVQEVIYTFTSTASVINTMEVHDNILYLGLENGDIYAYDGVSMTLVQQMSNPIRGFVQDFNLLYVVLKNDLQVYFFNGSAFIAVG
jgi:hypothetical protein